MATVRLQRGLLHLDSGQIEGTSIKLSPMELKLVTWLVAHPEPAAPDTLLTEVWGYKPGVQSRTVYSTVDRLRKKIEVDPSEPVHLLRDEDGYRLVVASDRIRAPDGTHGRDEDLQALVDHVLQGGAVALHGPGGVGKSHLARDAVQAVQSRVAEHVWVELGGVDRVDVALERIRLALGVQIADPEATRMALSAREPLLLVLDDVDHLGDRAAEVVTALHAGPGRAVLVTSRHQLPGVPTIPVEPLPAWAAVALLRDAGHLDALTDEALQPLLARLDGLPLALRLAAPWVERVGVDAVLDNLAGLSSVEACVLRSWALASPRGQDALLRLAWVGAPIPLSLAVALLPDGLDVIDELFDESLVQIEDARVLLLETVRAAVLRQGTVPADVPERALRWAISASTRSDGEGPRPARELTPELDALLAILRKAPHGSTWQRAVLRATDAMLGPGLVPDFDTWLFEIARRTQDPELRVEVAIARSRAATRRRADPLEPLLGTPPDPDRTPLALQAAWHQAHGEARFHAGDHDKARAELIRALELQPRGLSARRARYVLARMERIAGAFDAADRTLDQLEADCELARDDLHRALAIGVRASVSLDRGDLVRASGLARSARDLALQAGELEQAALLNQTVAAVLYSQEGAEAEVVRCLREAGAIFRRFGLISYDPYVRHNLGGVYFKRGEDEQAEAHFRDALAGFRASGSYRGVAAAHGMLGRLHFGQGRLDEAVDAFEACMGALGDQPAERSVLLVFAYTSLCRIQRGERALLAEVQGRLPDEAPFDRLKELAALSASDDPADHETVRRVVRGTELDRSGVTL